MLDLTQRHPARSPADSVRPSRFPRVTRVIGKAMSLAYRLAGKDRYDDFRLERVLGVPLVVMPSVFNPKLPRTGAFLAAHIDSRAVARDADVLDMGTGAGVCAGFAARHATPRTALAVNPAPLR